MTFFIRRIDTIKIATLLILFFSVADLSIAQETAIPNSDTSQTKSIDNTRFKMKLRMDDAKIAELKSTGFLKADLPTAMRNKIDGVRISRDYSFVAEPIIEDRHVEKRGDTLIINVNDAILDRLDYQPFLSRVYYSNYSTVLLAYKKTIPAIQSGDPLARQAIQSAGDPPKFFARIDQNRGIRGTIESLDRLKLKTTFGSVEVDLDQIEGMRFDPEQPKEATVWLRNQDRISGTLEFDRIKMICSWGTQPLKLADLMSITRDRFTQLPELPTKQAKIDPIEND